MKLLRMGLVASLIVGIVGVALVADSTKPVGTKMSDAANGFLATLPPELKQKAFFPYDSDERINWNFVPMQDKDRKPTRKGLGLFEMNEAQQKAAMELLRSGTSEQGYTQATTIMSLEAILRDLEKGGNVRDPQWYFVAIFGEPSKTGQWAWRVEGHHLSINFQIENGEVVGTTPFFYGSNPAEVVRGPNKGDRVLSDVQDIPFELIESLTEEQKLKAQRREHFPEISQTPKAPVGNPVGVAASELTKEQQQTLLKLMKAYATRMPPSVAQTEMERALKAGVDKIHFAYSGNGDKTKPHTYRIHGPTFVIEFLNIQADSLGNVPNHVHSAWRRLPQDF